MVAPVTVHVLIWESAVAVASFDWSESVVGMASVFDWCQLPCLRFRLHFRFHLFRRSPLLLPLLLLLPFRFLHHLHRQVQEDRFRLEMARMRRCRCSFWWRQSTFASFSPRSLLRWPLETRVKQRNPYSLFSTQPPPEEANRARHFPSSEMLPTSWTLRTKLKLLWLAQRTAKERAWLQQVQRQTTMMMNQVQ